MKNYLVSRRYAKAFFNLINTNDFNQVAKDIELLVKYFDENSSKVKSLLKNINSSVMDKKSKNLFVEQIASNLHKKKLWKSLFGILIQKHRFDLIPQILRELDTQILEKQNKQRVNLKLAVEHSPDVINKIRELVSSKLDKDVIFDIDIDKSIIGGFIAETDKIMIDGSIEHNFRRFVEN